MLILHCFPLVATKRGYYSLPSKPVLGTCSPFGQSGKGHIDPQRRMFYSGGKPTVDFILIEWVLILLEEEVGRSQWNCSPSSSGLPGEGAKRDNCHRASPSQGQCHNLLPPLPLGTAAILCQSEGCPFSALIYCSSSFFPSWKQEEVDWVFQVALLF